MKKHVIENFLKLPGILGLALMDGPSCAYFYGIEQFLDLQQRDIITRGIQQIISTTPVNLQAFDFRFSHESVHVYKLSENNTLLVLTGEKLDTQAYQSAIMPLQEALQTDLDSTVASLQGLVESLGLDTKPSYTKEQPSAAGTTSPAVDAPSAPLQSPFPPQTVYQWEDGIGALNSLTDATAKYLGQTIAANTWRTTRPDGPGLESLQFDREGHFSYALGGATKRDRTISPEDHEILLQWVQNFIKRCSLIIRNYPEMVLQQSLNHQQRAILEIEIN